MLFCHSLSNLVMFLLAGKLIIHKQLLRLLSFCLESILNGLHVLIMLGEHLQLLSLMPLLHSF